MKKAIAYSVYFAITAGSAFVFHYVLFIWISMSRFTAADGPPGDIGITEKIVYSVGLPGLYFGALSICALLYSWILKKYRIEVSRLMLVIVNGLVSLIIIERAILYVFD